MKKILTASALSVACLWSASAFAAGYQLNEYSVTGLGRSFAGAGIMGDDYSALAYNPAGMTLMKKSGMQAGLTVAQIRSSIKDEDSTDKAHMDFGVPLPNVFGQYNVNDRLSLGMGVYAPFGLETKYKKNSFLSNDAIESTLEVVDFAPAAAYKLDEHLSVGATFIARYIHGKMTNTLGAGGQTIPGSYSEFDLDGWTYTGVLGAMYEFNKDTRVGVSYKMKSVQTVKGDHKLRNVPIAGVGIVPSAEFSDGNASPDLPPSFLLSGYHRLNDKFGLSASVRWTDWTVFDEFAMYSSGGGKTVQEQWRDTWTIAGGLDYYLNSSWTLRTGLAWDQSPVEDSLHRTARIPDSDRIWASLGLSYAYENIQVDAGYAHLFMKEAKLRKGINSDVGATYDSYSNMFGVQMQYNF